MSQQNTLNVLVANANNLQLLSLITTYVQVSVSSPSNTTPSQQTKKSSGNNPNYNQQLSFALDQSVDINECTVNFTVMQYNLLSKDTVFGQRSIELREWHLGDKQTLGLTFALNDSLRGWLTVQLAYNSPVTELKPALTAALFQSQKQEYPTATPTTVLSGQVPDWLNGTMLSQIGGQWEFGKDILDHYFDTPSMINKFDIKNQQVSYQSKFLQSSYLVDSNRMNKLAYINFSQTPQTADPRMYATMDNKRATVEDYPVDIMASNLAEESTMDVEQTLRADATDPCDEDDATVRRHLQVTVKYGSNLANMDSGIMGDVSDPYCITVVTSLKKEERKEHRTKIINNNLNPVWDETFNVEINHPDDAVLRFTVYDKDTYTKDDLIGYTLVELSKLCLKKDETTVLQDLVLVTNTEMEDRGTITVELKPIDFSVEPTRKVKLDFDSKSNFLTGYGKNANVNVEVLGSGDSQKVIAITDVPYAAQFDPVTLNTVQEPFKWSDNVSSMFDLLSPAHPQYNPVTGMSYNVITSLSLPSLVQYKLVKYSGPSRTVFATIPAEMKPRYWHSFSLTNNYMILVQQPFVVNFTSFMMSRPVIESFEYSGDKQNKILVIDVNTGQTFAQFTSNPFSFYHTVNAYEYTENDQKFIAMDLVAYEGNWNVFAAQYTAYYKTERHLYEDSVNTAKFKRIILPLPAQSTSTPIVLTPEQQININPRAKFEMPTINPTRRTQSYTYVYGNGINSNLSTFLDNITKVDVTTGEIVGKWTRDNLYPGEALFVPKPNATSEDDGVLLSIVRDVSSPDNKSFLLILDGKTMEEVARVQAPCRIPAGIHGIYMNNQ